MKIYPPKLKKGDEVRVIACSRSFKLLSEETINIANKRLTDLGFKVTFGKHINEMDEFSHRLLNQGLKTCTRSFWIKT